MRACLLSLSLLSLLLPVPRAHSLPPAQGTSRAAYKFLEYGDVPYESVMAKLDQYALELHTQQPASRGYVVVYRGRRDLPGINHRYALREKNYLVNYGIEAEQVVTIDGGVSDSLRVELWMVPGGANLPVSLQASQATPLGLISTVKYDEQYHPLEHDTRAFDMGEEDPAMLDGYANQLRANPELRGYVIGYAQYCATCSYKNGRPLILRDAPGTAGRMLEEKRQNLIRRHRIDPSRIVLIDGGYRGWREIELWLVPPGAPAPRPSSNVRPRGRRRR